MFIQSKITKIALLMFLGAICVLPIVYLTVVKPIDAQVCYREAAKNVGVEPTYDGIVHYIKQTIKIGMNEQELEGIIGKLGVISPRGSSRVLASDRYILEKGYTVLDCFISGNNIAITVYYNEKNEIEYLGIYEWP